MEVENGLFNSDAVLNENNDENHVTNIAPTKEVKDEIREKSLLEVSEENLNLKLTIEKLEQTVASLQAKNLHANQLEITISQQRTEIEKIQTAARQKEDALLKQLEQLKKDCALKIDKLSKQFEQASKEREAMVMKYAVSENSVITVKNQMKQLEGKIREHAKEKESLEGKITVLVNDKARLSQTIDSKNNEILALEREIQKKKDELHAQSSNLKFFQNKLKIELESQKDIQNKMDKVTQKLKEAKEETEQVRKDSQSMLLRYESEGRKELETEYADQLNSLRSEVESWRVKHKEVTDDNNQLCKKVQNLESERLDYEKNLSGLKESLNEHQQSLVDFYAVQAELESLRLILNREQERFTSSQSEVDRLRLANQDLLQEMSKCREREAELLNFTRKLTEKNVAIQSDLIGIEARVQQQEIELNAANRQVTDLSAELGAVKDELAQVKQQRQDETDSLSKQLEERVQDVERLKMQVEDEKGEKQLLKKKHLASIKELTREIQSYRKKGEALETMSLGKGSHTSSNTSLNNDETSEVRVIQPSNTELDPQLLIDKIIQVQKMNAKMRERKAFLKEHNRQLTEELQKKSRIIQNLILKQNSGALSSDIMDENKAALAKQGGIMASVYNSKPVDDSMTLELSLEMNQKLQAVLEDTLLKNFTLKENMDTLGNEIANLKLAAAQSHLPYSSKS